MSDFTDGRFYAVGGQLRKAPFHKKGDDGKTTISIGFEVAKLSEWVDEDFCAEMAACLNAHDELVAALSECATRFEKALIQSGTDPDLAAEAAKQYRSIAASA